MKYLRVISIIVFLLALNFILVRINVVTASENNSYSFYFRYIVSNINLNNLNKHLSCIMSAVDRYAGYSGCYETASYICSYLKSLGLKTWIQNYTAIVPYDSNSTLVVVEPRREVFRVYVFAPNLVYTCRERIRGELVYLNRSFLETTRIGNIKGKIVLVDLDCGYDWIYLKFLGVKAIVFIEKRVSAEEWLSKVVCAPLKVPRVLIKESDAEKLLSLLKEGRVTVELFLNMEWREVVLQNVFALIPGSVDEKNTVVVSVQYDACSVVPSISPGASSALSTAALLEFARILKGNRPARTVLLAFFSGSALSMLGARTWFYSPEFNALLEEGYRPRVAFVLDLSGESSQIRVLIQGLLYGTYDLHRSPLLKAFDSLLNYIATIGNYDKYTKKYTVLGKKYSVVIAPSYYYAKQKNIILKYASCRHLGEVFNIEGIPALTFYSPKSSYGTPLDVLGKIDLTKVRPQLEVSFYIIFSLVNDLSEKSSRVFSHTVFSRWCMSTVKGKIQPHINSSSTLIIVTDYLNNLFVYKVSKEGFFEIYGLRSSSWGVGFHVYRLYAFTLNSSKIIYASKEIRIRLPLEVYLGKREIILELVPCSTLIIEEPVLDFHTFRAIQLGIEIFEKSKNKMVDALNLFEVFTGNKYTQVAILILPSNTCFDIVLRDKITKKPLALVPNIILRTGEEKSIPIYRLAEEIIKAANSLLKPLAEDPTLSGSLGSSKEYFEKALKEHEKYSKYLNEKTYSEYVFIAYRSLYYAIKSYYTLEEVYMSISNMNIVLVCILLPFSIVLCELLFEVRGTRKMLYVLIISASTAAALIVLHPGFRIHSNLVLLFASSLSLFTSILSLLYLVFENYSTLIKIREKLAGKHFIETAYKGIFFASFSLSVRNMKKRPLRTALTALTVVLLVSSITLIISWRFRDIVVFKKIEAPSPLYAGFLVKEPMIDAFEGIRAYPIPSPLAEYIECVLGNRARIYPRARIGGSVVFLAKSTGRKIDVLGGVIGLKSDDPILQNLFVGMLPEGSHTVFISRSLQEALKVSIGDVVTINGEDFVVIGVFSDDAFARLYDIDGYLLTPVFITRSGIIQEKSFVAIVPYDTLLKLGGGISSILVVPERSEEELMEDVMEISQQISGLYHIYYSDGEECWELIPIKGYELQGLENILVPLIISCLVLSNTILGSTFERRREYTICSSLGLSPSGVAFMALSEGLVYSVVGVMLGYITAACVSLVARIFGYSLPLDVSSPYLPLAIIFSIAATLASSVYPALSVFKTITPSLKRKWEITTKPLGNEWYIPLPFRVGSREECLGVLNYLAEYFEKVYTRDFIVVEKPVLKTKDSSLVLALTIQLAPYDAGISEYVEVIGRQEKDKIVFGVLSVLKTGKRYIWVSSHKRFIDHLRKQLLLWRTLKPKERLKYMK